MKEEFEKTGIIFNRYGPLITRSQTARILQRTPTRIRQMIKEGKLRSITCLKVKMIPFQDILNLEDVTSDAVPACAATPESASKGSK